MVTGEWNGYLSVGKSEKRTGPPEAALSAVPLEAAAEAPAAADAPAAPPAAEAAEPPASVCVEPMLPAVALAPLAKKSGDVMPTAEPTSLLKRTRGSDAFRRRAFFAADSSDDLRADCATEQRERGAICNCNWNWNEPSRHFKCQLGSRRNPSYEYLYIRTNTHAL